jgi:hypothetical protein
LTLTAVTARPAPTVTPDPATGTTQERATLAQGLIDLAVFLIAHPAAPIISFKVPGHDFTYWVQGSTEARVAEVDRIAAIIGQRAYYDPTGRVYQTERDFGVVHYRAVAVLREQQPETRAA